MVSREIVERLLEELAGRLNKLHQLREVPWPEFQADWKLVCATERVLQTAIQAVLDVGAHILAEFEDNQWEEYRDIPERLARHGVIPKELVPPLQGMVGLRNVLVHQYVEVDTKTSACCAKSACPRSVINRSVSYDTFWPRFTAIQAPHDQVRKLASQSQCTPITQLVID